MNEQKVQCRLCEQYFNDEDMSEEHYPAHSVGNDDIIELDLTKFMDTLMGDNPELKEAISAAIKNGEDPKECADKYFDQHLAKDLYPKGRTARTLCRKCNTFLGKYDEAYKKFYSEDGDSKKIKGFQKQTKYRLLRRYLLSSFQSQKRRIYILIFWILFVIRRRWSITALGNCILLRGIIQQI